MTRHDRPALNNNPREDKAGDAQSSNKPPTEFIPLHAFFVPFEATLPPTRKVVTIPRPLLLPGFFLIVQQPLCSSFRFLRPQTAAVYDAAQCAARCRMSL